ncbi:hypothetical protein FFLO_03508 [Filobasidium floriforme]|uniref:Uncharacterized protein n=1 Tax=Filobasidium floriforme TaxID=5210 RepID=A0A8K0NT26_9TREE|nr:uncharacterized protein HD553DRAFT_342335 [Filobasidium floriforme]KAG7535988.1 hypothetical protein FFLO_03508 [Filobasidium floriforme]KAH8084816.1 hypothetical protein HD553DRAFT_342335 [Filobasidium floriforme]
MAIRWPLKTTAKEEVEEAEQEEAKARGGVDHEKEKEEANSKAGVEEEKEKEEAQPKDGVKGNKRKAVLPPAYLFGGAGGTGSVTGGTIVLG